MSRRPLRPATPKLPHRLRTNWKKWSACRLRQGLRDHFRSRTSLSFSSKRCKRLREISRRFGYSFVNDLVDFIGSLYESTSFRQRRWLVNQPSRSLVKLHGSSDAPSHQDHFDTSWCWKRATSSMFCARFLARRCSDEFILSTNVSVFFVKETKE